MNTPGPTDPSAPGAAVPGSVLAGRFRIERVLGRGGMGEVLLAVDTLLGRRVAVKHLRAGFTLDMGERRSAILREARRASQVSDPHIAAIHDVVDLGEDLLIVMEYVDGETLRRHLGEPLRLERFWSLSRQCLDALGAAHAQGVIHRDIKPENLMLTGADEIKILDFGIAWRASRGEGPSVEGTTAHTTELRRGPAGTPLYMAPETHYGGRIDERTDLFSLGVVFYEMLTGRHPFQAESYQHLVHLVMNTPPRAAAELNPAVTAELSGVILRMLARDPAERFASCSEARAALLTAKRASGVALTGAETFALAESDRPPPVGAASRPDPWKRWAWALVALAVAVAGGVTWRVLSAPRLPADLLLAVIPPAAPGATEDFAAYALGATELLATRLMRHQGRPGFQMLSFANSYEEKPATAGDARKALGANLALFSSLEQRENRLRARLELREPLRERVLGTRTVDVPLAEPFTFADSLYHAALALLGLPGRPQSAQEDVGVRGAGTLRFLLQGIGRRRASRTPEEQQRALQDFETAYRTEPDPAAPRRWLAMAQMGLFTATRDTTWLLRAEVASREAVALDSLRSESHRTLAHALGARKQYTQALEHYAIACRLDPTDDDAWHPWGRMWLRAGKPEEERGVYLAAIQQRPHCFKPRWWLASWDYRNGRMQDAVLGFREMILRSPAFFQGYSNLGGLLLFLGRYQDAVDTLRLAVELRPNATAFTNLGTAYFSSGRLTEAVEAYNQAFQFDDADYHLWMNLGDAYYWLRDRPDQARDAYRQAVRLGRAQMTERAQRSTSRDPMIPAHLASMLPKLDEPDSARAMLSEALSLDSLNSRVQYQAALTLWQLGEKDPALEWLRRAVAGGYPVVWLRDSPVHRDWREEPGFQSLVATVAPAGGPGSEGNGGGR